MESLGHQFIVTTDKDGPDSRFERELPDTEIVISQPFWPAYLTAERIAKAPKLKLVITAGIGSDHTDFQAAIDHGITVTEITYSNSISVAEHAVMMILALVRNYIPSYEWIVKGGWNIADRVARSYDLEGMHVGTVAAGRIGTAVLRRLKPFDVHLHYYDRRRLPEAVEKELGATFHPAIEEMVKVCDVVTIHAPLHPETDNLFNAALLAKMKRGPIWSIPPVQKFVIATISSALWKAGGWPVMRAMSGFRSPRLMITRGVRCRIHGMTPHISGSTLSAQARYAAGTREIRECWFENRPIRREYLIVDGGKLAGAGAHAYSAGNATAGSEEAARFKSKS